MCGRFTLRSSPQAVAEAFCLSETPALLPPHFNIAPGQPVAVVRLKPQAEGRELAYLRWGLIPAWADDPSSGIAWRTPARRRRRRSPPSAVPFGRGAAWWSQTVFTSGRGPTGASSPTSSASKMTGLRPGRVVGAVGKGWGAGRVLHHFDHGRQRVDAADPRADAGHPPARPVRPLARSSVSGQ